MEVIASEFPDIYKWLEPSKEPACEVEIRTETVQMTDDDQSMSPIPRNYVQPSLHTLSPLFTCLEQVDSKHNAALQNAKQLTGCRRQAGSRECDLGERCPFVRQILGLDELPASLVYSPQPRMQRIMVVKQTSRGLVKVTETNQSFTEEEINYIQQLTPENQIRCITDLSNGEQPTDYDQSRPIKEPLKVHLESRTMYNLPTPSPSPPSESDNIPDNLNTCPECSNSFRDSKQLLKHRRNHHQLYSCKECGEKMIGYYKMASHSKKVHSKEPIYFCECGRNFGEKKGMTKHQNTCALFKQKNSQVKIV